MVRAINRASWTAIAATVSDRDGQGLLPPVLDQLVGDGKKIGRLNDRNCMCSEIDVGKELVVAGEGQPDKPSEQGQKSVVTADFSDETPIAEPDETDRHQQQAVADDD